jgi:hypothetical protein
LAGATCDFGACNRPGGGPLVCGRDGDCPTGTSCVDCDYSLSGCGLPRQCFPRSCAGRSDGDYCAFGPAAIGTCCGGACVTTRHDARHCGGCGQACSDGLCVDGACKATTLTSCATPCAANQICVAGQCVGLVCGDSVYCRAQNGQLGQCCPDGSCVDFASDANNCGGCGVSCNGQPCIAGSCVSAACDFARQGAFCGSVDDSFSVCCGASCIDTRADNANCGRCGRACTDGKSCRDGNCQ